jgi:hypothetical protein
LPMLHPASTKAPVDEPALVPDEVPEPTPVPVPLAPVLEPLLSVPLFETELEPPEELPELGAAPPLEVAPVEEDALAEILLLLDPFPPEQAVASAASAIATRLRTAAWGLPNRTRGGLYTESRRGSSTA